MTNQSDKDDILLQEWLQNKLTDAEITEAIGEEAFTKYTQILNEVDLWTPSLDAEIFDPKLITQARKKPIQRTISIWKPLSIAASIILFIGLGIFLFDRDTHTYETAYAEIKEIELPDGSMVTLGPKSNLEWSDASWSDQSRTVSLTGKANFKVISGSDFEVNTNAGKVEVLGTVFDVLSFGDMLHVKCYEGKVRATSTDQSTILIVGGQSSTYHNNAWEEKTSIESFDALWITKEPSFKSIPLAVVIKELESIYGIHVVTNQASVNINRRFTGTIPNNNLDQALEVVFGTLDITYNKEDDTVTLSN